MRILIAEDDNVSRFVLERTLTKWGHEVVACQDGVEAVEALEGEDPPRIAILDWMMPRLDGLAVCRHVRATPALGGMYLMLLTARTSRADLEQGFAAGADDYITKPFDRTELRARLLTGIRIAEVERTLSRRVADLEEALTKINALQGLLPMCAWCRKVRDDDGYWDQIESYVASHTGARISHGICPECAEGWRKEAAQSEGPLAEQEPEAAPAASGQRADLCGELSLLPVSELVQTLHGGMKTGVLRLAVDGVQGVVAFQAGEVQHAALGERKGEEAFYALLALGRGRFEFADGPAPPERSVFRPAMGLLMEGMRRMDERASMLRQRQPA